MSPRSASVLTYFTLCLITLFGPHDSAARSVKTSICEIQMNFNDYFGKTVDVEGVVIDNDRAIMFSGTIIRSLLVQDGSAILDAVVVTPWEFPVQSRVHFVCNMTKLDADGDQPFKYLDCRKGNAHITAFPPVHSENAPSLASQIFQSSELAVPSAIITTPWSLAVDLASLAAAVFSVLAVVLTIYQIISGHSRYSNILTKIRKAPFCDSVIYSVIDGAALIHIAVQLITAGKTDTQLSDKIIVKVNGYVANLKDVQIDSGGDPRIVPVFPMQLQRNCIMHFIVDLPVARLVEGRNIISVVFRDVICGKRFRASFDMQYDKLSSVPVGASGTKEVVFSFLGIIIAMGFIQGANAQERVDYDTLFSELEFQSMYYPEHLAVYVDDNRGSITDRFVSCYEKMAVSMREQLDEVCARNEDCQRRVMDSISNKEDLVAVLKGTKKWLETYSGNKALTNKKNQTQQMGEHNYQLMVSAMSTSMKRMVKFPCVPGTSVYDHLKR